jgi:hypothetical protein
MEKNKIPKLNGNSSQWWRPNRTEYIMLIIAVLTLVISILAQIPSLITNTIRIGEIYTDLYPILNAFHLFIILYAMSQMRNIKELLPDTSNISADEEYKEKAENLVTKLKEWISNYVGSFYYEDYKYEKSKEIKDEYVKKMITNTNNNINKLYRYWRFMWIWLFFLYVVEFAKSMDNSPNDTILPSLVIVFNNLFIIYWFFVYLKLSNPNEVILTQKDKKNVIEKLHYNLNKNTYRFVQFVSLSRVFGKRDKHDEYENGDGEDDKYKKIEISRNWWKIVAWGIFGISVALLIFYNLGKFGKFGENNNWCKCFKIIDDDWYKGIMYISVLFGASSMLAAFSRLGSGFFKIPISALLLMLFYSAVQPLFFASKDLAVELKAGQFMFIINLICLLGKVALLYIIKWIFRDYRIAYYFINEQIINSKKVEDKDLKNLF